MIFYIPHIRHRHHNRLIHKKNVNTKKESFQGLLVQWFYFMGNKTYLHILPTGNLGRYYYQHQRVEEWMMDSLLVQHLVFWLAKIK